METELKWFVGLESIEVSEELNSVETGVMWAQVKPLWLMFQKNLIVWKRCMFDFLDCSRMYVSEELNSVETQSNPRYHFSSPSVSEELNSVETKIGSHEYYHALEFQKNLIVWKQISGYFSGAGGTAFQKNLIVWKHFLMHFKPFLIECFRRT